jgi:hypothetical protein
MNEFEPSNHTAPDSRRFPNHSRDADRTPNSAVKLVMEVLILTDNDVYSRIECAIRARSR